MSRLGNHAAFAVALISRNVKQSFALRGAFWLSASFMLLNNVLFFTLWWILMARFEHVRGWRLSDVMCLYGISAGGFGCAVILAGGVRDLARKVHDGGLDAWLTQPKSVLMQAVASQTNPSGWGDMASSVLLLSWSGAVELSTLPFLLIGLGCAAVTFIASGVVVHSLAFWLGRTDPLSRALWDFTVTFSVYPPSLFGPWLKLFLFTILPAGLVSYLPVELLKRPSLITLASSVLGTASYAAFAAWFFARGLRRYESGNRFSVQG